MAASSAGWSSAIPSAYFADSASVVLRVRSLPEGASGMSTLSSTMASATVGSSPRASASARNSPRMADTYFSGAFTPCPLTGVAAPKTAPDVM